MSEEEVNYASVVFKTNKHPPPEAKKEEETVYDEVKVQTANTNAGLLPDKKANNRHRCYQPLAFCLGILCIILLSGIIAVGVYLATLNHESDVSELNQLKENQTTLLAANHNLTALNAKLSSESEKLRKDYNNLTVQVDSLTQASTVLESNITDLRAENQQLNSRNQELETQKNNLTEQIRVMETNWNELNVSRAQWSINAYCLRNDNKRCGPCQSGWLHTKPNCYVIHNAVEKYRKTWEEAQENCNENNAALAVIHDQNEKDVVSQYSWESFGTRGYWIGLRVVDGKWKWIDGSDLTESSWIEAPSDGHCAISVINAGWKSVRCDDKQQWICRQKALSV